MEDDRRASLTTTIDAGCERNRVRTFPGQTWNFALILLNFGEAGRFDADRRQRSPLAGAFRKWGRFRLS